MSKNQAVSILRSTPQAELHDDGTVTLTGVHVVDLHRLLVSAGVSQHKTALAYRRELALHDAAEHADPETAARERDHLIGHYAWCVQNEALAALIRAVSQDPMTSAEHVQEKLELSLALIERWREGERVTPPVEPLSLEASL